MSKGLSTMVGINTYELHPGRLLDLNETAEILRVSAKTVKAHVASGEIPYINVGSGRTRRSIRIEPKDLVDFITKRKQWATPKKTAAVKSIPKGKNESSEVVLFSEIARPARGRAAKV